MDNIKFNQTGGFPLDTDIMGAMQSAYNIFNQLGSLAGDRAIISGCGKSGNTIADGVIFLNGEILPFKGGTLGTNVIIKEENKSRVFEDGATKPVIFKRYATFGTSTPEKTFAWADFKRFDNLLKNAEKNADFEKRLKALETKKSPIPIGLVAIWGKPASEPIPEGWREYEPLRGRFPVGWNPNDNDIIHNLSTIEGEGGAKTHTLGIEEMPRHSHESDIHASGDDSDSDGKGIAINTSNREITRNRKSVVRIEAKGGNQPHNNMPPYRIIKYIEFIGFN